MADKGESVLLSADDPPPVRVSNPEGSSLFLLLGDHAGNSIPRRLGTLGLSEHDLERHIALDIGVSRLGCALSKKLDATFIEQRYSRLVVDCNRDSRSSESIVLVSDGTAVSGNVGLDAAARETRLREIFDPYHAAIAAALVRRDGSGRKVILISLHSFTPQLNGETRPWDLGILYDRQPTDFAVDLIKRLRSLGGWHVGDNQPYRMDATDYTVPRHGYPRQLSYSEIEVRQDNLGTAARAAWIADRLKETLVAAADQLG